MKTVIVSILSSIAISLLTFILGLKSGKNQADRAFLQDLYKQLYAHFSEIEIGLKEKQPKRWQDYKKIEKGNRTQYCPLVRDMQRTGNLIYIDNKIAKQALQLEMDCLNYQSKMDEICRDLHEHIIKSSELFIGSLKDVTCDRNKTNSWERVETINPNNCNSFTYIPYEVLLDKEKLIQTLDSRDIAKNKSALVFYMRGNPHERELKVYPDSLFEGNIAFAENIAKYASDTYESLETEKELVRRIEKIKRFLENRAKNPTVFWETFTGAFIDIFRT